MIDVLFSHPLLFLIVFPGLLLAITVHEFAHALVADKLGDPTPRYQGRVTLDPRAHLDPIGTVAIFLTRFGWGKPVQFDPYNLKEPIRDAALIAMAGPVSNLIFATLLSIIIHLVPLSDLLNYGLMIVMQISVMLAVFNLLPVYPLDGSKVLPTLLPKDTAYEYEIFMRRYGIFVLIFLILPIVGPISPAAKLILPVIDIIMEMLLW